MDALVQQQVVQLVQAAQKGDQQAAQQIQEIQLAAKQGDQQAMELLQVIQQMLQSAKEGAKLQYIKRLRGNCPEGYEMEYFKAGGKVCGKCMKKAAKKAEEGTKISEPEYMRAFKAKCGAKVKKVKGGDEIHESRLLTNKNDKGESIHKESYRDGNTRSVRWTNIKTGKSAVADINIAKKDTATADIKAVRELDKPFQPTKKK